MTCDLVTCDELVAFYIFLKLFNFLPHKPKRQIGLADAGRVRVGMNQYFIEFLRWNMPGFVPRQTQIEANGF